jgi:drug/metabolite transporter (DMT)-like permease
VNPLVAIILGAALLDEQLTVATGLGAALIVGSVFVAVRKEGATPRSPAAADAHCAPADQTA